MEGQEGLQTYEKRQRLYLIITLSMIGLNGVLIGLGYLLIRLGERAPEALLNVMMGFMIYHGIHFLYGIIAIIHFFKRVKHRFAQARIFKTILGVVLSPVSFILCYAAVFLLALTRCSISV
ncbi:MAG: hypothetical protein EA375_06620 [Acholeplasmataceae bacterium]|nr:MAG: hypothetical protein EA375_06620 [Acholeplasmataceae bacterium]